MKAFLETYVKKEAAETVYGQINGFGFENNYSEADGGRIWIVWDLSPSVVVYKKSPQMVVCGVFGPDSKIYWTMAFRYMYNTYIQVFQLSHVNTDRVSIDAMVSASFDTALGKCYRSDQFVH